MIKPEILIIDDEIQLRKLLSINLISNGYKVIEAENGLQGIQLAANHNPELIILDLNLPDLNGQQVLKDLRLWYNKSIFILSVINRENEIVKALDEGATDYLTKPFRTGELLARIRASIKRHQTETSNSILIFENLEINLTDQIVKKNNVIIRLTSIEFKLLILFATNEGRILTHRYILKEIWGVGAQSETQYLRVFVGILRKKLEENPSKPRHFITENGIGYRFY